MKKLRLIFHLSIFGVSQSILAQNADDALRYSQTNVVGTARSLSMGGAFGALGGDFSTLSTNPAGLAIFRKSEIMFSPSIYNLKTVSTYNNNSQEDFNLNFNFGNSGLVLTDLMQPYGDATGWVSRSFGFGYNRTNNFHSNITIEGENNKSSLLDVYLANALNNGNPKSYEFLDHFGSMLAYNTYLIDDTTSNLNYFSQIPNGSSLKQRKAIKKEGSMGETYFAFAGNYSNKLYLGASIGFSHLNFSQSSTYQEITNTLDSSIVLQSYKLNENLSTKGKGMNLKAGIIYRITDWVRMGLAFHTPTYYNLEDSWDATINAKYKNSFDTSSSSPKGSYSYELVTPAKIMGSLALIISRNGLLGLDYELIDYSSARLRSNDETFFDQNDIIQNELKPTGNLRIGAEWKIDPFSIRGGYNLIGNPYKETNLESNRNIYSVGFGIKEEGYYIDLAYAYATSSSKHFIYDPTLVNETNINMTSNNFLLTVGFKF